MKTLSQFLTRSPILSASPDVKFRPVAAEGNRIWASIGIEKDSPHEQLDTDPGKEENGAPTVNSKMATRVADILITEGYPVDQILKTADRRECDIIVMGTHGRGFVTHTLLGSVAERVLRGSQKPVFTIPLPKGDIGFEVNDL